MSSALPIASPANSIPNDEPFDLVEMLLAQQQSLTAVERFSAFHEAGQIDHGPDPAQAKYYQQLLPATPPGINQQFAFQVDLDACSGCKACVVACHTMNGLEEDESWRRVGTLTVGDSADSRVQHVTTACHHCEDPGCLNGCPVRAYEKDPDTGIVRHLDDQCIGCKYCTMMCPYEVPRYSKRLGIVRKCDMCHQRLSVGEAPACVQSCPNGAISIRIVDSGSTVTANTKLAPEAPCSTITRPSTEYVSNHQPLIDAALPQDSGVDDVAESHWPLAAMLVTTQISVGMLVVERIIAGTVWLAGFELPIDVTRINTIGALLIGMLGMAVAPLHLGQPLRAWRIFLGLRTSWLSREAVLLGKYVGLLVAAIGLLLLPQYGQYLPESVTGLIPSWALAATLAGAIVCGIPGLLSSAMIYVATKRKLWRLQRTLPRFLGTALVGGLGGTALALLAGGGPIAIAAVLLVAAVGSSLAKLYWEFRVQLGASRRGDDRYDRRSRRLIDQQLSRLKTDRMRLGTASSLLTTCGLLAVLTAFPITAAGLVALAVFLMVAGEYCERLLYFKSVVYDRMPGTMR